MKRREFIGLVGGATIAWPLAARAQQAAIPVIGLLNFVSFQSYADRVAAFRQGLRDTGFVEGQNVIIEYRSADGRVGPVPALAADLVRRNVAVIVAIGGDIGPLAAKATTSTIPIVFATGGDPITDGLVTSLSRPEANITGVSFYSDQLAGKRLELLRELLPGANPIAFLTSFNPTVNSAVSELAAASRAIGLQIVDFDVKSEREIDAAFVTIMQQRIAALVVQNDAFLNSRRDQIIKLAARHAVPTIYAYREHILAGGLVSYGTNVNEMYRQAGIYAGRILKGAKPADLPVVQPTKFELIVNLKTAKALGLAIPESFLLRADQVIE
jgi:putative ABC transport system substrate-binding protein